MKYFVRIGFALLTLLALSASISAQSTNLLANPGFEEAGNYNVILASNDEGTVFGVPPSWDGWISTTPRSETWMNLVPDGYPHTGLFKFGEGSSRSLSISRGFATFTTAVFQRVSVAAGTNVRGSARGFMERGNTPPPGAQFRVGIDPTGGENPLNPAVVWSPWVSSPNSWVQATVDATSASGAVTLFLYSTQTSPSNPNAMYWDDARLETGGLGGTAAASGTPGTANVLPTPAFAPFVAPQGVREDGSIVHIVAAGDTLDAIAVAYRTTRDEILRLNNMTSRNFLQIGQEILVRPPTAQQTPDPSAAAPVGGTLGVAATGVGTQAAAIAQTVIAQATSTPTAGAFATNSGSSASPTVPALTTTGEGVQALTPGSTVVAAVDATTTREPSATPAPEASPTDLPPAPVTEVPDVPTMAPDVTALCAWMFDDANQNRIQEASEPPLAGGIIEIKQGDEVIESFTPDGSADPTCFFEIEPGDYTALATAPDGYGLTTAAVLNLRVQENARTNVRFGAGAGVTSILPPTQVAQAIATQPPALVQEEAASDSLLQMSGLLLVGLAGVVILGGIGLALFIRGR
jgi:LysM repeat protein